MIPYFPQPYPDELFYSMVVRYHIHTGSSCWVYTLQELFKAPEVYQSVGSFLPNAAMQVLVPELPAGILTMRGAALEHSLFRFCLAFQSMTKKEEYLNACLDGENLQSKFLIFTKKQRGEKTLRWCPACFTEDVRRYGEPYYHTEHQIELLPLCPIHSCRLLPTERRNSLTISRQLVMLPDAPGPPDYACTEAERQITEAIHTVYQFHFDMSPDLESGNLQAAVENAGYLMAGNVRQKSWDTDRLYQAMIRKFGEDIVRRWFGQHITRPHALRLRKYEIFSTEEYILLCVLLALDPRVLFGPSVVPIDIEERMRALAATGRRYTKARAAELLGVREDALLPYARRFGVQPFWGQSGKSGSEGTKYTYGVTIHLSRQERELLDRYMAENHFDAYSHVLRYFMEKALREWNEIANTEEGKVTKD